MIDGVNREPIDRERVRSLKPKVPLGKPAVFVALMAAAEYLHFFEGWRSPFAINLVLPAVHG
jgi:hypothetical protein